MIRERKRKKPKPKNSLDREKSEEHLLTEGLEDMISTNLLMRL